MAVLLTRHLFTSHILTGSRSHLHSHQGSPGSILRIVEINNIFGIWACLFIDNHQVRCVPTLCIRSQQGDFSSQLLLHFHGVFQEIVYWLSSLVFLIYGATHPASVSSAVHRNRLFHTSSRLI